MVSQRFPRSSGGVVARFLFLNFAVAEAQLLLHRQLGRGSSSGSLYAELAAHTARALEEFLASHPAKSSEPPGLAAEPSDKAARLGRHGGHRREHSEQREHREHRDAGDGWQHPERQQRLVKLHRSSASSSALGYSEKAAVRRSLGMSFDLSVTGDSAENVSMQVSKGCDEATGSHLQCTLHLDDGDVQWSATGAINTTLYAGDVIALDVHSHVSGLPLPLQVILPQLPKVHVTCPACGQKCTIAAKKFIPGLDMKKLLALMPELTPSKEEEAAKKHRGGPPRDISFDTPACGAELSIELNRPNESLPLGEVQAQLDQLPRLLQSMVQSLKVTLGFSLSIDRADGSTVFRVTEQGTVGRV